MGIKFGRILCIHLHGRCHLNGIHRMLFRSIKNCLTVYSTSKQVQIKSTCLALTYLVLVATVWIAYIGSLKLDVRKIYQKSCPAHGAIVSKVKGVLSTEYIPDEEFQVEDASIYKRVWDISDIIVPPYGGDGQDGSFVVFTNLLITPNQTRGLCSEENSTKSQPCKKHEECDRGKMAPSTNGILTGKCIKSNTCEISAWCPIEQTISPLKDRALLEGVQDFTIMLKNSVEFPDCGADIHRRNILENITKSYLSQCIYDMEKDTFCPIFRLGDIIHWSGHNFSEVAITGGVFRIEVRWNCDFDWGFTQNFCFPTYHFSRTDVPSMISPGWNFRMASYHEDNRRTLQKVYGLKMLITIAGEGRRFDFLTLILTLGATVGLFALAPLVCDHLFQFLCLLKKLKPCANYFGDFSMKSKFQPTNPGTQVEIAMKFEYSFSTDIGELKDHENSTNVYTYSAHI